MNTFKLEITTPDGVVYSGEVEHVRAPGVKGSFGVLAGHTPFITPLDVGEIELQIPGGEERFATSGGLADVRADTFLILVETCEPTEAIDIDRAKSAYQRAKERLEKHAEHVDQVRAKMAMLRASNRLKIAGMK